MKGDEAWDLFIGIINAWEVGYGTSLVSRYYTPRQATRGQVADILLRVVPALPTDIINYELMPLISRRPPILPPSYESVSSMISALTIFNSISLRPMFHRIGDGVALTEDLKARFKVDDWVTENRTRFQTAGAIKLSMKFFASILPTLILFTNQPSPTDYALICFVRYVNDLATMVAISYMIDEPKT